MTRLFTPFPQARHKPVFPLHSSRKPGLFVSDSAKLRLFLQEWRVTRHSFYTEGSQKRFVHSASLPREKQARATLQRSGAMLVPGKRFETNKKSAILLVREKLHSVFSLKGSAIRASFF